MSLYDAIALVVTLFVAAAILLRLSRPKTMRFSVLAAVLALSFTVSPSVFAAEGQTNCIGTGTPDSTQGAVGQVQSINVTLNDTATPGYSFVLSSLKLALRSGHVLGSSVSTDQKTLVAPGEGTYVAQNSGVISFTPSPTFTGVGVGVTYSILDTAGVTTTNTYIPTVTGVVSACTDPASETRVLAIPHVSPVTSDGGVTFVVNDFSFNSGNSPALDQTTIDIDPTLAGKQVTFTRPDSVLSYDPVTDVVTINITDLVAFSNSTAPLFRYTLEAASNCQQPDAKDVIIDSLDYNVS